MGRWKKQYLFMHACAKLLDFAWLCQANNISGINLKCRFLECGPERSCTGTGKTANLTQKSQMKKPLITTQNKIQQKLKLHLAMMLLFCGTTKEGLSHWIHFKRGKSTVNVFQETNRWRWDPSADLYGWQTTWRSQAFASVSRLSSE